MSGFITLFCKCGWDFFFIGKFVILLSMHLVTCIYKFDFHLQCNRLLRWCPSPDCNNAIKVQYVEARPVTCKCTHTFCFACGENWHDPVKCHLLRKWIKKCDDDSETSNWIAANTKVCKYRHHLLPVTQAPNL